MIRILKGRECFDTARLEPLQNNLHSTLPVDIKKFHRNNVKSFCEII